MVAAAEFADEVAWCPNRTTHRTAAFPGVWVVDDATNYVEAVAVADMDGDGSLDLVTGTRNEGAEADITVWRAAGGWTPVAVDTDFDGATTLRLVDVNRDGALDILSYAIYSEQIAWFENAGPTTYLEHPIASGQGNNLDAADLDCDGDLDVVAVAVYTDHLTWWRTRPGTARCGSSGPSPPLGSSTRCEPETSTRTATATWWRATPVPPGRCGC